MAGHPRSPYHRVDALASARHVRVTLEGELLAESSRPMAVFETGEPARFYFAQADVRRDLLEPSETVTISPYMGTAVWFSARVGGELHADVAWTYRFTIPQLRASPASWRSGTSSCASSRRDRQRRGARCKPTSERERRDDDVLDAQRARAHGHA